MIERIYYWFHNKFSRPDERGEYSSGYWQDAVRQEAFRLSDGQSGRLLEVGCGEGLFLSRIAKERPELNIYGVDVWKEILDRARERFDKDGIKNVRLECAEGKKMPFKDKSFDTIVCVNVLFNIPSEEMVMEVLCEISRVSKNGAKLILDIRNSLNPLLHVKYGLAKFYDATVRKLPLKMYSLRRARELLKRSGFEIAGRKEIGFPGKIFSPIIVIEAKKV